MEPMRHVNPSTNIGGCLTRRAWLRNASWLVGAIPFPNVMKLSMQSQESATNGSSVNTVMDKLSNYMSEARNHALPYEVIEAAKLHILDTLAAMISGSELPPGRRAIQFAHSYGGERIATVVGSNILCGPIEAALTNAMLAQSDETDDSHPASLSHPGCSIIPAALAAGERFGINGTHFVRAVTLGYDIGPRVTMTLGGWDFVLKGHRSTHSVAGVFGSAAAAGCAASLTVQQMRWLLDYTAQESSGLAAWQRDTEHIEKAFVFAGMPAQGGITAALVVQSGWTGVDDILSGTDNFLLAYAPTADPAKLIDKLGEHYIVAETNIKKWSVGSPIQAPLDALENILKRPPFEVDQVQEVTVRLATHEAATVSHCEMPDICLQYMVAVMMIDKTAGFHAAHDKARMQDPSVLNQRAKVKLIPDEELQRLLPQRVAIVDVLLSDGTHLTERVQAVRGTPDNPMTRDEVVSKARDLIIPVLGDGVCNKLVDSVLNIESAKDVRDLRPLIQK